jgi:hypothetical protein
MALPCISFTLASDFYMLWNVTIWGLRLYCPLEGRCAADFYHPWKSIASATFEPAILGSSGKHTNHYTTEATEWKFLTFSNLTLDGGEWLDQVSSLRRHKSPVPLGRRLSRPSSQSGRGQERRNLFRYRKSNPVSPRYIKTVAKEYRLQH